MKTKELSKEQLLEIMNMHKLGTDLRVIASNFDFSQSSISVIVRAYNGNATCLKILAKEHQATIKSASPYYSENYNAVEYECKILFGLFTLIFKPKK